MPNPERWIVWNHSAKLFSTCYYLAGLGSGFLPTFIKHFILKVNKVRPLRGWDEGPPPHWHQPWPIVHCSILAPSYWAQTNTILNSASGHIQTWPCRFGAQTLTHTVAFTSQLLLFFNFNMLIKCQRTKFCAVFPSVLLLFVFFLGKIFNYFAFKLVFLTI